MFNFFFNLFIIAVLLLTNVSCGNDKDLVIKREFLMDTVVEITVADRNHVRAEKAIEKAFNEIKRIESFADPIEGDELLRVNNNAGKEPVAVSEDFFFIIDKALQYSKLTGGAFDISITPVLELWGFIGDEKEFEIPESKLLLKALNLVGYQTIVLDENKNTIFFKKKGMKLTLGAIAKGYAVGRAVAVLKKEGVKNAIVNAGGDIQVIGSKFGKPWLLGMKHPRKPDILMTTMKFKGNKCVVTSGDYERYFISNNKRYHHIIDPSTGFPADSTCISVTVMCSDPVEADALVTGVFVLGPEKGMELIESLPKVEAIMVCETKEEITIRQSKNIIGKYKFKP